MKLLGKDLPQDLWSRIEERLAVRGLAPSRPEPRPAADGVEPRVEPLRFNLSALEENADPTRGLPLHTHRGGAGQAVLVAKWIFRKSCQVLINETLGRQRVFNGLVLDSYAQLSAEVLRLRRELDAMKSPPAARSKAPPPAKPVKRKSAPRPGKPKKRR